MAEDVSEPFFMISLLCPECGDSQTKPSLSANAEGFLVGI